MKTYNFLLKGIRHCKDGEKMPFTKAEDIKAFNFSHALSHVLNLAKESHIEIKKVLIEQYV